MRQGETERERRYRVAREYEGSGETRVEYARRVGLAPATLDYYRRRARETEEAVGWVEVEGRPAGAEGSAAQLVLVLGEDVRVEVGAGFDAGAMARLLEVLGGRR